MNFAINKDNNIMIATIGCHDITSITMILNAFAFSKSSQKWCDFSVTIPIENEDSLRFKISVQYDFPSPHRLLELINRSNRPLPIKLYQDGLVKEEHVKQDIINALKINYAQFMCNENNNVVFKIDTEFIPQSYSEATIIDINQEMLSRIFIDMTKNTYETSARYKLSPNFDVWLETRYDINTKTNEITYQIDLSDEFHIIKTLFWHHQRITEDNIENHLTDWLLQAYEKLNGFTTTVYTTECRIVSKKVKFNIINLTKKAD